LDRLNELIAENLKDIRKGKGLSLEQVSSLTTISKSAGKGRSESYDIDGV